MNIERAKSIAMSAHSGDTDLSGKPYIGHVSRVAAGVNKRSEKMVAWLHDVVEDTDWTIEDLRKEGFGEDILKAVDLVTKKKNVSTDSYYSKIKSNPLAKAVKLSDLADNMNLGRFKKPSVRDIARAERYKKRKEYLMK